MALRSSHSGVVVGRGKSVGHQTFVSKLIERFGLLSVSDTRAHLYVEAVPWSAELLQRSGLCLVLDHGHLVCSDHLVDVVYDNQRQIYPLF